MLRVGGCPHVTGVHSKWMIFDNFICCRTRIVTFAFTSLRRPTPDAYLSPFGAIDKSPRPLGSSILGGPPSLPGYAEASRNLFGNRDQADRTRGRSDRERMHAESGSNVRRDIQRFGRRSTRRRAMIFNTSGRRWRVGIMDFQLSHSAAIRAIARNRAIRPLSI